MSEKINGGLKGNSHRSRFKGARKNSFPKYPIIIRMIKKKIYSAAERKIQFTRMAEAKLTLEKLNKCCWKKKKDFDFFLVSAIKCEACRHCHPPLRTDGRNQSGAQSQLTHGDPVLPFTATLLWLLWTHIQTLSGQRTLRKPGIQSGNSVLIFKFK